MIVGTVYLITNTVSGKIYVGQTEKTIEARLRQHIMCAPWNVKTMRLARAILKYGSKSFTIKRIVHVRSQERLNEQEIWWIAKLGSNDREIGYNLTKGGGGVIPTKETREKMSESARGRVFSPETRRKISEGNRGKIVSLETREKISKSACGRVPSKETREKMSRSHYAAETSEVLEKRSKSIRASMTPEVRKKISEGVRAAMTPEVREKISKAGRGRVCSLETRKKKSDASRGKSRPPEHIQAMRDGWKRRREQFATLKENAA